MQWVPSELEDEKIMETMSLFGQVMKGPFQTGFEVRDDAPELTQRLKNIKTNNRMLEMVISRNIPSYVKIGAFKIKVVYQGQDFTCARCYKSFK